jgi:Mg2+ and Co2+ transporter CorA
MDYEADERLLRENLHHNPPLHIRRTLDQSYFLTLEDTSVRDKDQVVYRETREGRSFHTRNTRVVMVDQLWLWILDGNTIITSFPRRWGRNKPDPSGVHKSLRERLESTPAEEIQSVYDLALIIIDQCSRVFFDRTKPLDQRPEVMDLFASAIGSVTEHTTIAYESFWRNMEIRSMKIAQNGTNGSAKHSYLDINPEGTLLRESQDVAEELQIMLKIYNQQLHVVRDFRKILGHMNGESKNETEEVRTLIKLLRQNPSLAGDRPKQTLHQEVALPVPESTIQEANDLLELIRNRKAEIQDLEEAALQRTQQLQGLLSLKQQQASIIEAKAALARADESVKQGRAIMAFTIVTIFFLPLGFIAAFFGMNNEQINQASWMTLNQQMKWMFGISTAVIVVSISIAFSPWTRATLTAFVKIPIIFVLEYTGLRALWKYYIVGHGYFEEKNRERIDWIHGHRNRKEVREAAAKKKAMEEDEYESVGGKDQRATSMDMSLHGEKEAKRAKRAKPRLSWKKRPSLNAVNVGGMVGSGALNEEGEDIEKGHRTIMEDEG